MFIPWTIGNVLIVIFLACELRLQYYVVKYFNFALSQGRSSRTLWLWKDRMH